MRSLTANRAKCAVSVSIRWNYIHVPLKHRMWCTYVGSGLLCDSCPALQGLHNIITISFLHLFVLFSPGLLAWNVFKFYAWLLLSVIYRFCSCPCRKWSEPRRTYPDFEQCQIWPWIGPIVAHACLRVFDWPDQSDFMWFPWVVSNLCFCSKSLFFPFSTYNPMTGRKSRFWVVRQSWASNSGVRSPYKF